MKSYDWHYLVYYQHYRNSQNCVQILFCRLLHYSHNLYVRHPRCVIYNYSNFLYPVVECMFNTSLVFRCIGVCHFWFKVYNNIHCISVSMDIIIYSEPKVTYTNKPKYQGYMEYKSHQGKRKIDTLQPI